MKKLFSLMVLLCLCVSGAWAYDVPDGYEVKEILLGKNTEGVVSAETFDEVGASIANWTNKSNFAISIAPTESWDNLALHMSGNVMRLGSRTTHDLFFDAVKTSGKIVFSTDFYVGTHQKQIQIIGANNEVVAYFAFADKSSGNTRVNNQQYLYFGSDYSDAAMSATPQLNDTYLGTRNREYQISEVVIDLDANTIKYTGKVMDRRSSTDKWCDDAATITYATPISGIKGIRIDATPCGNSSWYAYFDNMTLYSVGLESGNNNYIVNARCGETVLKSLANGVCKGGMSYSVSGIPEVIKYNNTYYRLSDNSVVNHTSAYMMGNSDEERTVEYTEDPNIVYYGEWETDYSTTSGNYAITNNENLSNGKGRTINRTDVAMALSFNVTPGIYRITMPSYNSNEKSRDAAIKIDDAAEEILSVGAKAFKTYSKNDITLDAGSHTVTIRCTYNLTPALDYILVEKTASLSTMSAAGYTTFSSTSNIDADAIEGGKAYVINAFNAENVVLTPATGIVPANTGMIIAGEGGAAASAGTVTIPVSTAAATFDASNNLLVACATETTVQAAAAGKKNYVLAYNAADAANTIGFYYIGATSATVAAGKAYLTVDEATPAKMFRFSTGNTTGIKAVSNEMTTNKVVKRIMNGQLVIEKAGKMYNAAGAQMK